jgi:hypothetical protein
MKNYFNPRGRYLVGGIQKLFSDKETLALHEQLENICQTEVAEAITDDGLHNYINQLDKILENGNENN